MDNKLFLDAFAAIFVRDHEVVAIPAASASVPNLGTGGDVQVWQFLAIQDPVGKVQQFWDEDSLGEADSSFNTGRLTLNLT